MLQFLVLCLPFRTQICVLRTLFQVSHAFDVINIDKNETIQPTEETNSVFLREHDSNCLCYF